MRVSKNNIFQRVYTNKHLVLQFYPLFNFEKLVFSRITNLFLLFVYRSIPLSRNTLLIYLYRQQFGKSFTFHSWRANLNLSTYNTYNFETFSIENTLSKRDTVLHGDETRYLCMEEDQRLLVKFPRRLTAASRYNSWRTDRQPKWYVPTKPPRTRRRTYTRHHPVDLPLNRSRR